MTNEQTHVIVGASLAGAKAVETLREEGFDGRVVLVGAEDERPYERPPLSKDYLRGEVGREKVYVHDQSFYAEHDIELRLGRTAVSLDTSSRELALDDGARLRYDRLLLTTGAEPRRLSIPGAELDGVLYLRSVQDSDTLRERLDRGGAVVVVGAGWIGAEVAASARQRGLEVTVLDPAFVPLERVMGTEVGAIYSDIHTEQGVRMLMGTGVEAFEGDEAVERVRTSDGRAVECDFVVVGVGVQPRVQLAADAGLDVDNGVLVDEHLRTSAVALASLLSDEPEPVHDPVPYFWSDQFGHKLQYAGVHSPDDKLIWRDGGAAWAATWVDGAGRLTAVLVADRPKDFRQARLAIHTGSVIDVERLADPDIAIADL
jgi:3-phenylpropionate/trans-cinnamate dioxygenase ferredoxin reductase subunit